MERGRAVGVKRIVLGHAEWGMINWEGDEDDNFFHCRSGACSVTWEILMRLANLVCVLPQCFPWLAVLSIIQRFPRRREWASRMIVAPPAHMQIGGETPAPDCACSMPQFHLLPTVVCMSRH